MVPREFWEMLSKTRAFHISSSSYGLTCSYMYTPQTTAYCTLNYVFLLIDSKEYVHLCITSDVFPLKACWTRKPSIKYLLMKSIRFVSTASSCTVQLTGPAAVQTNTLKQVNDNNLPFCCANTHSQMYNGSIVRLDNPGSVPRRHT